MTEEQMQVWINEQIQTIKTKMPETYRDIQKRADKIGALAFALVKRGLRGEPDCFWAMEGGYVMGTPFKLEDSSRDLAWYMVSFGCLHVCIFRPLLLCEASDGKN